MDFKLEGGEEKNLVGIPLPICTWDGIFLKNLALYSPASSSFKFHPNCKELQLTHLCFADDDLHSIGVIRAAITEFNQISGLSANSTESEVFFASVQVNLKQQILHILMFMEGHLPVRYLGVPLISGKLKHQDCIPLLLLYLGEVQGLMILGFNAFGSC